MLTVSSCTRIIGRTRTNIQWIRGSSEETGGHFSGRNRTDGIPFRSASEVTSSAPSRQAVANTIASAMASLCLTARSAPSNAITASRSTMRQEVILPAHRKAVSSPAVRSRNLYTSWRTTAGTTIRSGGAESSDAYSSDEGPFVKNSIQPQESINRINTDLPSPGTDPPAPWGQPPADPSTGLRG